MKSLDELNYESSNFLKKTKFPSESYERFIYHEELFNEDNNINESLEVVLDFIKDFRKYYLYRYDTLERYYNNKADIKYKDDKTDIFAADNRIQLNYANYIVQQNLGLFLSKPISYLTKNETLQEKLDNFVYMNNDELHNQRLLKNMSIFGTAYELMYNTFTEDNQLTTKYGIIDTKECFVVYNDEINPRSLFAVRIYETKYHYMITIYTDTSILYFSNQKDAKKRKDNSYYNVDNWTLVSEELNAFNKVSVTQYFNNDEMKSDFENVLDLMDALDLSVSEEANAQQNNTDALLVLTGVNAVDGPDYITNDCGDMILNPNGRLSLLKTYREARILTLTQDENGTKPNAQYLMKPTDTTGLRSYQDSLIKQILKLSLSLDITDDTFKSNLSGVALEYATLDINSKFNTKKQQFTIALKRRFKMYLRLQDKLTSSDYESDFSSIQFNFTSSLPKADSDIVNVANTIKDSVSRETFFDVISQLTNVDASEELRRVATETKPLVD